MSKTPQRASSSAAGDDRNLVLVDDNYLAPSFEDRLRLFWEKNSRSVIAAIVLVFAVVVGKGVYEFYQAQKEKGIAADYAAAGNDSAKLKAFAASHDSHVLGGTAQLRIADAAYSAGNYTDSRAAYDKAASILKKDTFGPRARLGAAISAAQSGAVADASTSLKAIAADNSAGKIVRSEAAYQAASIAADAGNSDEAIRLIEQATVIDPDGVWASRASDLRASLPASSAAADAKVAQPAVSFTK